MLCLMLMLLLLMPSVAHAQVGNGVAVCCGRQEGFRNNPPPIDSRRFAQQFSGRMRGQSRPRTHDVLPESGSHSVQSLQRGV